MADIRNFFGGGGGSASKSSSPTKKRAAAKEAEVVELESDEETDLKKQTKQAAAVKPSPAKATMEKKSPTRSSPRKAKTVDESSTPSKASSKKKQKVVEDDEDEEVESDFEATPSSRKRQRSPEKATAKSAEKSPAKSIVKTAEKSSEKPVAEKPKSPVKVAASSTSAKPVPNAKLPSATTSSSAASSTSKEFRERPTAPPAARSEHQLWADKYAPGTFDDLVGAQSLVKNLDKWLKEWDDVHLFKRIKIPYDKSNPGARAALLSGPPGIGKSTTARLVAEHCGREIYELNASDTRSKKLLSEELSDVVQAGVVSFEGKKKQKKRVIIMDEVDGMSASDRGGVAELIKIIKTTRTPVICICNDYSKSSVRSLANHCFDLKFQRPQVPSILKRLKDIARKEDLKVEDEALEGIIKSSGNDIRQVLNALQMWRTSSSQLKDADAKERIGAINKDAVLRLSAFDATRFIFCESHNSALAKRNEAFFSDYDMIPLMVSQNYVAAVQASRTCRDDVAKMKRLAQAADAVCDGDIVAKYVRSDQRWDLLTSQAMMNVRVAHVCDGPIGFPGFPEWLGKNSNATKRARLLGELTTHVRASRSGTSLDKLSLRLDYIPAMRSTLIVPLAQRGADAVDAVIEFLDDYSMNRDDLFDTLSELQFPESAEFKDYYKLIQPQAKAAFTREYNKRAHRSQVLVGEDGVSKKSKRRQASAEAEGEDDEGGEEEAEEEEVDIEAFRAKSKKTSSASSKKKKA